MRITLLGMSFWACSPAAGPGDDDGTDGSTTSPSDTDPGPTGPDTDTDTDGPSETGSDPTVPTSEVDCSLLLDPPLTATRYDWVPGSEDFTFDADGYMLQITGGGLKRTPYGGPSELLVPLDTATRGTRLLPDGRLAMAAFEVGGILLVDPATGGQEVAASGIPNPNGIAVDPDGRIYTATSNGRVYRVDVDTGEVEVVVDMPGNSFDGIAFSPDFQRVYFNEELGQIHFVDLDADGNPGPVRTGARIPTAAFSILDGMAVDACGNLYVTEMNGRVWRVRTDGTVEQLLDVGGAAVIPALNFGIAPIGGWRETALYVLTFTGSVFEVEVGVPGKWEPHLPR